MEQNSLQGIERGNTQKGVNFAIIRFISKLINERTQIQSLLDIPCGQGEFLRHIRNLWPSIRLAGLDLFATPLEEIKDIFHRADARESLGLFHGKKFDVITSISGVMCFDNVSGFFKSASEHLNHGGYLIMTNDNIHTVRDKLSFLFFGRLKRFKLLYSINEGNWNVVLIQGLWKHYRLNGITIEKVEYVSLYPEDLIFIPLAIMIYPIWLFSLFSGKSEMPIKERLMLFPFKALICRHYIIYGKKV